MKLLNTYSTKQNINKNTMKKTMKKTKIKNPAGYYVPSYREFSKNLGWNIIIPIQVQNYLYGHCKEEPFKNFRMENALYFLSQIFMIPANRRNAKFYHGFVPLKSQYLKKVDSKYKLYLDFLISIGLIEKMNYSTDNHQCNRFRINYKNIKMKGEEFLKLDVLNLSGIKIQQKLVDNQSAQYAYETCEHLIKWLDAGFTVQWDKFDQMLAENFKINKFDDSESNREIIQNAQSYFINAKQIENQSYRFSRNHYSDNRLHTNLTNLPKDVKKCLLYDDSVIKGIDIKNSQPYFFTLAIDELLYYSENKKWRNQRFATIFKSIYGSGSLYIKKIQNIVTKQEFKNEFKIFKVNVVSGQYYEFLGEIFADLKPNGAGVYQGKFYNKNTKKTEKLTFETKRDFMKKLSMLFLYTPLEKPSSLYAVFKAAMPNLCELMELLKSKTDDLSSYKLFPKLLQQFEADCVLDFVTRKTAIEEPEIPLFTIHDSISTPWYWYDKMEKQVIKHLTEYCCGSPLPKLSSEYWGDAPIGLAA